MKKVDTRAMPLLKEAAQAACDSVLKSNALEVLSLKKEQEIFHVGNTKKHITTYGSDIFKLGANL